MVELSYIQEESVAVPGSGINLQQQLATVKQGCPKAVEQNLKNLSTLEEIWAILDRVWQCARATAWSYDWAIGIPVLLASQDGRAKASRATVDMEEGYSQSD